MKRLNVSGARWRQVGIPVASAIAGAALAVGVMSLWGGRSNSPAGLDLASAESTQQTTTVALQTLEESVSASGSLAAVTSDSLAFEATGKVTAVYVQEGDVVEAGDVLAEIDTLQLTADLASARAELVRAEATLADAEDEADGTDESDAQIASAEAALAVKQEAADDAEDDMANAQLVAPIGGLVTSVGYAVGDSVSGGSASSAGGAMQTGTTTTATTSSGISIVGQEDWTVSVSLAESDVALIEVGDQVTFSSDDVSAFYGVVTDVSALPSTSSGTAYYPVTLTVTGAPDGLFDGIDVTAEIVYLRKVDVLAIPTNAITTTDGTATVTVVAEAGTTEARQVSTGEVIGSYTEITDGLAEGESIEVTTVTASTTDRGGQTQTGERGGMQGFDPSQMGQPGGFDPSQMNNG